MYLLTEIEDSLPELDLFLSETVHSVINRVVGQTTLLERTKKRGKKARTIPVLRTSPCAEEHEPGSESQIAPYSLWN